MKLRRNTRQQVLGKEWKNLDVEEITFTKHAAKRMASRGIPASAVLAVIKNGKPLPTRDHAVKLKAFGLIVVLDENRVLTTYKAADEEVKPKDPKPKRAPKKAWKRWYKPAKRQMDNKKRNPARTQNHKRPSQKRILQETAEKALRRLSHD